ncbi:hypothetical protein K491DRAFT_680030 [Lophiostoma macrostomum CBS 122681]|uniref:Uncharacterized protein n=1 Tax=Lophiostoma macrostomum CBS 122681 TaxID=1314788 RepID=A0A6A6T3U8_9PLEO|nr:hypothetical protein K491DRAFT_680030 [Lophiostoma macrostomum CBS 122681]
MKAHSAISNGASGHTFPLRSSIIDIQLEARQRIFRLKNMPLKQAPLEVKNVPIQGARREYFEDARKNHVPRYLFRAYAYTSGGGPTISRNSVTEIVPPAFLQNGYPARHAAWEDSINTFYNMREGDIENMARKHYQGDTRNPPTGFSSWASSMLLALCYAQYLMKEGHAGGVHIAVMDTKQLDREVPVWHVPLSPRTRRPRDMSKVFDLLPELRKHFKMSFGHDLRASIFQSKSQRLDLKSLAIIRDIASLFGSLCLPVAVALINTRPRPWMEDNNEQQHLTDEDLGLILEGLGAPTIPTGLSKETWLVQGMVDTHIGQGMVDTHDFPDVRQWIKFLRVLVQYDAKARGRGETELESNAVPEK